MKPSIWEGSMKKMYKYTGYIFLFIVVILLLIVVAIIKLNFRYYFFKELDKMNIKHRSRVGTEGLKLNSPDKSSLEKEVDKNEVVIVEKKKIPKIIIQTWKSRSIPSKYLPLQTKMVQSNPSYQYLFFTDEDIDTFLKTEYPEYYVTFQKLPILIQKIDFFRYVAVYHYGGFYFDLDMELLEPLDDSLLDYNTIIPIDDKFSQSKKDLNRQWIDFHSDKVILGQYAFGAVKHSGFMKFLIDNIHYNIDLIIKEYNNKVKNNISNFEYFVYSTTGPDYVTYMYKNYYSKWEVSVLDYPIRQHFGKYARHRYFGTWKNNTNN